MKFILLSSGSGSPLPFAWNGDTKVSKVSKFFTYFTGTEISDSIFFPSGEKFSIPETKVCKFSIDVDKNEQIAAQYNIQSVPTMILFKNGQVIWRESGMKSVQQLVTLINQHLD
jgi:thioredoxin 1